MSNLRSPLHKRLVEDAVDAICISGWGHRGVSQTERHEVAPRKEYVLYPCALLNQLTITRLGGDRPAADLGNLSNSLTFSLQKGRLTPSPCVWATLNGGTMARGFPSRSHTKHCGFHWLPPLGLLAREVAGCHAVRALKQPTEKPARGGPKAPHQHLAPTCQPWEWACLYPSA